MEITDKDGIKAWETHARVYGFEDRDGEIGRQAKAGAGMGELINRYRDRYRGVREIKGNMALYTGLEYMIKLLLGIDTEAVLLDSTHAVLGVGASNNAAAATQTELEGERLGSGASWGVMDAGFPSRTDRTMIFRATFLSGVALFNWQEWAIAFLTGVDTRVLLNRKVDDIGTKPEFDVWIIEVGLRWA